MSTSNEISRRRVLGLAAGAALAGVLAACGDDDDGAAPATSAPGTTGPATTTPGTAPAITAPTASSAPAGPRAIDTINGPIEVPAAPSRVVALNFVDTANLLDLGVTPLGGTTSGVSFLPAYKDQLAAMTDVITADGLPNIELIASLKPDLIVGSDWVDTSKRYVPYDDLKGIAPTVLVEWQQAAGNWADQAVGFAAAVGRSAELDALRGEFESKAAEIKTTHADVLAEFEWALVQGGLQGDWFLYTPQSSHGRVLEQAGVRLADIFEGETGGFIDVSAEELGRLSAAGVIGLNVNESAAEGAAALRAQPLWPGLPAVTADRVFEMSWFFPSSYRVAMALLDELAPALDTLAKG